MRNHQSSMREEEKTGVQLSCSFFKLAIFAYFLKLRFIIDEVEFMVGTRETKFVPLEEGPHRIGVMAGGVKFLAERSATYLDFELKNNEVIAFVGGVPLLAFMKMTLKRK